MANPAARRMPFRAALALALVLPATHAASAKRAPPLPPEALMPPLKPAVFDETLEVGGTEIDARKLRTRMTVAVGINGHGPYRFVVDSGADTSLVGLRAARALKLPAGTPVWLNAMTESRQVERVLVSELRVGPTLVRDLELPALHDRDIGADGMLGLDALVEQRLMMDFEKRLITVDDARRPAPRFDGEIVVSARLQRGQLILTQVRANDRKLDAVVDTGSEITIGNLALRDLLIRRRRDAFTTIEVTGVTGATVKLDLAIVRELELGTIVMRNVPIAFAEVPPFAVFGLSDKPALLLGTDLMESFRKISLDFHARKVRFQLRRCADSIVVSTTTDASTRIGAAQGATEVCRR
jgi:gag-polyprotein putative aspartyl protease/Aspartyl protease